MNNYINSLIMGNNDLLNYAENIASHLIFDNYDPESFEFYCKFVYFYHKLYPECSIEMKGDIYYLTRYIVKNIKKICNI